MAITNAQQFKQLVNPPMEGKKRPGYRGEAAAASDRAGGRNAGRDTSPAGTGNVGGDFDRGSFQDAVRRGELKAEVERQEAEKREELFERFRNKKFQGSNFPGFIGMGLNLASPLVQKGMTVNRNFFLDKVLGSKNFKDIDFTSLTPSQQNEFYSDYMSSRLSGEIDAYGNPLNQGDDSLPPLFSTSGIMAQAPSDMDQESEIEEDEGLRLAFRANGGRIGFRGGAAAASDAAAGRDAGRDTSAAGTSDRGDGPATGGGPTRNVGGGDKPKFDIFNPIDSIKAQLTNFAGLKPEDIAKIKDEEDEDTNVIDTVFSEKPAANLQTVFGTGLSNRQQIEKNILDSMADGGRAGLAEGGMPYEGGIMDLESARQMYGLGKLVKKVTRTVKKIAKSPIGKAALLYTGLGGLGSVAGGGTFFGNFASPISQLRGIGSIFSGSGLTNIAKAGRSLFGTMEAVRPDQDVFKKNFLGKVLTSPTALIAGTSLLSGLLTAEQEEEAQLISDQTGIDIAEIRANPDKYLGRRFRAEGGSMKEPVAKKTMPLLDMGGKEMDLRAEGGFVPIGRMEKADDVPARLSKNEFVFTAEAVRNAGDGNVDKGAEVMYNMMKNLESGGDVSEESQGLEGARKMFQTSQRLEEVL